MANLFVLLSTPVRTHDGEFAVATGTIFGIEVKQFAERSAAADYQRLVMSCLHLGADISHEFVLIDSETDYPALREKFDVQYARLCANSTPGAPQRAFGRIKNAALGVIPALRRVFR